MSCAQSELPAKELFRRLAEHLDLLAGEVHLLEYAIGEELGQPSAKSNSNITRLQRLDFLRQSLEDIALLNLLMSKTDSACIDPSMAENLKLATTKQLLAKEPKPLLPDPTQAPLGDVDFF